MTDHPSLAPAAAGEATGEWTGLALGPLHALPDSARSVRELAGGWMKSVRGRWLHLRFAANADVGGLSLRLRGAEGLWPDTTVALHLGTGHAAVWAFIADHVRVLELQGDADALLALNSVTAEVCDEPPPEADVAVAMLSAAALYRIGVRSLRQVEFSEDQRWPLRATGEDPQLRFLHLEGGHRLHVELDIATDRPSPAAPVLYWADKSDGFAADASRPLFGGHRTGEDGTLRFSAGLPALRSGARWRLDPLDAPGRFRIDALRVHAEPAVAWPRPLQGMLDWLLSLRPERRLDDLRPARDLERLPRPKHSYVAASDHPQMCLDAPLAAGWYMLELELDTQEAARARARICLDSGVGGREQKPMSLLLRDGQLAKRLVWVRARSSMRLEPLTAPGPFTIRHFRLQRVSTSFALLRMQIKLTNARRAATAPRDRSPEAVESLWEAYCNIFEPHHAGALTYAEWIAEVERPSLPDAAQQAACIAGWTHRPLVSIVTPTFNTPPQLLRECLDSVLAQTYANWELCIADDASTQPAVREVLLAYAAREPRMRLAWREHNGHISQSSNSAIELARGDFIALLDHDDTLAPHALFAVVEALQRRPTALIVYSDEDKLDTNGDRCDPYFKPDWSPDLLRSQNYVSHLGVYSRELVESVGRFRQGYEGSQDYDLLLRCAEHVTNAADVVHVPQVLYHWRKTADSTAAAHAHKPYTTEAARRALQEHADRCTPGVRVSVIAPGLFRHRWPIPDPAPVVSLIVPTRDAVDVLRKCIDSIVQRTTYPHYEILVVDNQSSEIETLTYLEALPQRHPGRVRVLGYDQPFNYAAINNFAAGEARGTVLGFVNNDVEVISPEWLTEMISHAVRPEIGCVGAKLYYPDDTVQHAGVVVGMGGVANHSHKFFDRNHDGYFGRLRIVHNVSAVTGAVLLVRKAVFDAVGGMDAQDLQVAFNDVDLCLKVQAAGWANLVTPFAELYHHESKTRGSDSTAEKKERFLHECRTMLSRWADCIARDPFYNPNLTLIRGDYSLATDRPAAVPHLHPIQHSQTST